MAFNLTKRQIVCFGAGGLVGVCFGLNPLFIQRLQVDGKIAPGHFPPAVMFPFDRPLHHGFVLRFIANLPNAAVFMAEISVYFLPLASQHDMNRLYEKVQKQVGQPVYFP